MNKQHKNQYLYVTLEIHGYMFVLPIKKVRNIIPLTLDIPRIVPPNTSKYVNSVIILGKELITVIDFLDKIGKNSILDKDQIVALLNDDMSVGILAQNADLIEFTDNDVIEGGALTPESFMYQGIAYTCIDIQKLYMAMKC